MIKLLRKLFAKPRPTLRRPVILPHLEGSRTICYRCTSSMTRSWRSLGLPKCAHPECGSYRQWKF